MRGKSPKYTIHYLIWGRIVCEMKYAPDDYSFSIEEKEKLLRRIELFRSATGTRKGILPTLVTTFGLKRNANAAMITNVVTIDDLFRS